MTAGNQGAPLPPGRFAYEGLQRVFHEKARLGIMTSLVAAPAGLLFADLKTLCDLSDGNLNRHLEVLNEAGLVTIEKTGAGRGSRTVVQITARGRKSFLQYLHELEQVIADATAAAEQSDVNRRVANKPKLRPS